MDYEEILKGIVNIINTTEKSDIGFANICSYVGENCPELKESEDEKIKNFLIDFIKVCSWTEKKDQGWPLREECVAWLEKQGGTNETISKNEFAQGVLRGAAINLITWIDYNAAGGNMCLSNMECKDIEDALVSGDWDKIYGYIKKKLEKQGESKFEQCIQEGDKIVTNEDGRWNSEQYLEFQHDNLSTELKTYDQVDEEKHWQDVRERAAIAAMQAILSSTDNKVYLSSLNVIPKNAVIIADELVKLLKGEQSC